MRVLYLLFLVIFAGAVALFAWQNQDSVTLVLFDWRVTASMAAILGVTYVLGMLSGWSVVGMVRRSFNRVAEGWERREQHASR
jgi:lipopolysaccharide assembly protein A